MKTIEIQAKTTPFKETQISAGIIPALPIFVFLQNFVNSKFCFF
jgi:Flp pilus assembly protein TadB